MRNIKLVLQYEGTGYCGWQTQKGAIEDTKTTQSVIENCILKFTGSAPTLIGAGRTDSGVHALSQVASFKTESALPADAIKRALNALLPSDIRALSVEDAEASFHPRHDAKGKVYFYLIANMGFVPPFLERFSWKTSFKLDVQSMSEAASLLVGKRDFGAFMGSGSDARHTVREIWALTVEEMRSVGFLTASIEGNFIKVSVEGDGFLRHMVRNIVGTLVEVGRGRIAVNEIAYLRDRRAAGPTAPAKGLFLERVIY